MELKVWDCGPSFDFDAKLNEIIAADRKTCLDLEVLNDAFLMPSRHKILERSHFLIAGELWSNRQLTEWSRQKCVILKTVLGDKLRVLSVHERLSILMIYMLGFWLRAMGLGEFVAVR